jgi:hypothetical protein
MNGNYKSPQCLTSLLKKHKRATVSHIFSSQLLVFLFFSIFHCFLHFLHEMDPTTTSPSESSQSLLLSRNEENDDSWEGIINLEGYENHREHSSLSTFQSRAPHDRSDTFIHDDGTLTSELPTSTGISKHTYASSITSSDTDSSDYSSFASYDSWDSITQELIEEEEEGVEGLGRGRIRSDRVCYEHLHLFYLFMLVEYS